MASDRANCMAESRSLAAVVTRLLRIMSTKDGAAIVATMAMIATVTIISIRVKPLLCVLFIDAKPECAVASVAIPAGGDPSVADERAICRDGRFVCVSESAARAFERGAHALVSGMGFVVS